MASLNLSINGPSIKSSYLGVINGPVLSSTSATAARWALFTVQAPLLNAFQNTGAKESILKVESTAGECDDDAATPLLLRDSRSRQRPFSDVKLTGLSAQRAISPNLPRSSAKAACNSHSPESKTPTLAFPKMS